MFDRLPKIPFTRKHTEGICCFHFGRCGSTLLGNMLDGHPDLEWASEIFHAYHERSAQAPTVAPYELLHRRIKNSKLPYFGIETKFQHLDPSGLNEDIESYFAKLKEFGFTKFLLLKRKNYLRQAISVARGQLTGVWHVLKSGARPSSAPFDLKTDCLSLGGRNRPILECFQFLDETYNNFGETLGRLDVDLLEVSYEDHLEKSPTKGYQLVLDHCGLPFFEPEVSVEKLESRPISEIVSNFESVQSCLQGTEYQWMCDQ